MSPVLLVEERGYHRWDWYASEFAEWVQTPPGSSLIVEDCDAVTEANSAVTHAIGGGSVQGAWVELDMQTRFARTMTRNGHFKEYWDI